MTAVIWRWVATVCFIVVSPMVYAKADCRLLPGTGSAKVRIKNELREISSADKGVVFDQCDEMRLESGWIQLHYSSMEKVSDTAVVGRDAKELGVPFGQLIAFNKDKEAFTKRMRRLLDGPAPIRVGGWAFDSKKCIRLLPCGMIMQPENDLHIPIGRNAVQSARLASVGGTDSGVGVEVAGEELIIRQTAIFPGSRYQLSLQTTKGNIEQRFSVGDEQWNRKMTAAIAKQEDDRGGNDALARKLARLQAMRGYGLQFEADLLALEIEQQYPFLSK